MDDRSRCHTGTWWRPALVVAACLGIVLSPLSAGTAGAGTYGPDPGASDPGAPDPGAPDPGAPDPGAPDPGAPDPDGGPPGPLRRVEASVDAAVAPEVPRGFADAVEDARVDAFVALATAPSDVASRCASRSGVGVCLLRREAVEQAPAGVATASRMAGAEQIGANRVALSQRPATCSGTGADGYRVQAVYAYKGTQADPGAIQRISDATGHVDDTFGTSAARTGGSRSARWVTDHGGAGCRVVLRTARITSGASDFAALMSDLESQGAVAPVGTGSVKYLVWTEGEILPRGNPSDPRPGTCGLGEGYDDESPAGARGANLNLLGTRAAMDDRCWDINGGGSVPAHELMHTLGAVQKGAPNYANEGHCDDEYDLMCYGAGMRVVCPAVGDQALFDCGNDDYFNTDPLVDQYLCGHWNTAESPYLHGWNHAQPPRAVRGLSVSAGPGRIDVSHLGTASCFGADYYRVEVPGVATVDEASLQVGIDAPVGVHTVRVTPHSPYGDVLGTPRSTQVTVAQPATTTTTTTLPPTTTTTRPVPPPRPNRVPVGSMVLSLTDGRGYGMLAWAVDPDSRTVPRMRVVIPGVVNREYGWNYRWAGMAARTGWHRDEALVFLTRLPAGTHRICFDARDVNTGVWQRLECRNHTVK